MTASGAHNSCCQPHKSVSARDGKDGATDMLAENGRQSQKWVVDVLKGRKSSQRLDNGRKRDLRILIAPYRVREPNWIRISRNSTKSSKSDPILLYQDRVKLEVGGKQEVEGEAGTLDVTAFTLATLFRTVPVDEWYNQRSRGTPVLDEDGRE
ncbi:hypothetical protein G5I_12577 [Acromyrmex echinatior]|uniref:Uncharacterized protein n=1 Tax=Acromyrmex echinatior TaxID=103372 RepID=F4X2P6_ACREC|nr:hypothetical protein G5I_12577 [Acromyrmex echinatior]